MTKDLKVAVSVDFPYSTAAGPRDTHVMPASIGHHEFKWAANINTIKGLRSTKFKSI